MARIRNIKPDFWTDEKLVELDPWERLLFIGIWNFVDDEGFMPYSPKRIKMQIFPGDSLEVSRGLQNLISIGALTLYDSEMGKVLKVTNWMKHQKVSNPSQSKYRDTELVVDKPNPRNDAEFTTPITEPSPSSTELSREVHKEREGEGEREGVVKDLSGKPNDFDEWWSIYPRKDSKGPARTAYAKAKKKAGTEALAEGVRRYRDDPNREQQFTKLPATWLNSECWDDGPLPARSTQQTQPQRMDHSARGLAKGMAMLQAYDAQHTEPFELEA